MVLNKDDKEKFKITYLRHTHKEMAIIYNCSVYDIVSCAKTVGVHKKDSTHPCKWTDEQIDYISNNLDKPYSFISLSVDLDESVVFRIKQHIRNGIKI